MDALKNQRRPQQNANRTWEVICPEGITVYCDSSGQADEWLAETPCHAASWSIADVRHE